LSFARLGAGLALGLGLVGYLAVGVPAAPLGAITEYSANLPGVSNLSGIAPGPEGSLWFTVASVPAAIGRITTGGAISEFSAGLRTDSEPYRITTGPEGNLWFTDKRRPSAVGRITPGGSITEFSAGLPAESFLWSDIVLGPEDNLWFVDQGDLGAIGRMTPSGQITEFGEHSFPVAIAAGPEGDLWVARRPLGFTGSITRITPADEATVFSAGLDKDAEPLAIAPGGDGNLWFVDDGPTKAIGRITPSGEITEFSVGLSSNSWLLSIAAGPDGDMWFGDSGAKAVGRITMTGEITEYTTGSNPTFGPSSVAPGADGNVWFAGEGGGGESILGEIGTGAPPALVSAPVVVGSGQVGAQEHCDPAGWSSWLGDQPSSTLLAFDGYRWLLDGSPVATGQAFTPTAADGGQLLACQETVTYAPPLLVSAVGTSPSIAIPAPPPSPLAPKIGAAGESARSWREGSKLAAISSRGQRSPRRPPVGTTFHLSLNELAAVHLTFLEHLDGRHVGDRCEAVTSRNVRRKACTRTVTAGAIAFTGRAGVNSLVFQGRVSSTRRLAPGRYTLVITATDAARQSSSPRDLSFTIVK